MEMAQQTQSVVKTGTVFGTNRRPLGSAMKRQRARELASSQLSLFIDLEVLETLATIKPTIEKSDMEKVPSAPRIQHSVYNDVVTPTVTTLVHYMDRGDRQCAFPTWSDEDKDVTGWMSCGAPKSLSACYCSHHMQLAYGRKAA